MSGFSAAGATLRALNFSSGAVVKQDELPPNPAV